MNHTDELEYLRGQIEILTHAVAYALAANDVDLQPFDWPSQLDYRRTRLGINVAERSGSFHQASEDKLSQIDKLVEHYRSNPSSP